MTAEGYVDGELFLGKIAARQNVSGLVIKLRREGRGPDVDHVRLVGTVTRDGRPVTSGRVGAWYLRDEFNRINAAVQRGRTVPAPRFEMHHVAMQPDGTYVVEGVEVHPGRRGRWFLMFEEPGHAPTIIAPEALKVGERQRTINLEAVEGGALGGKVEHVPESLAGHVWVVVFNENVVRREVRVGRDGTFHLDGLPPGRYGLKVGHDAYSDPHIPKLPAAGEKSTPGEQAAWNKTAEPWQGAVEATVRSSATISDIHLDFRPPGPLIEK